MYLARLTLARRRAGIALGIVRRVAFILVFAVLTTHPSRGEDSEVLTVWWNAVADPEVTGYRVYLGRQTDEPLMLAEVAAEQTALQVTALSPGTLYCATVTSVRGGCESEPTTPVCMQTPGGGGGGDGTATDELQDRRIHFAKKDD